MGGGEVLNILYSVASNERGRYPEMSLAARPDLGRDTTRACIVVDGPCFHRRVIQLFSLGHHNIRKGVKEFYWDAI